jgi:enoyl-CoA hydratase/carnithine racemase
MPRDAAADDDAAGTGPIVLYEKPTPGVASLTLNRPQALNAINLAMRDELWSYLDAACLDPDVRVLVFRGAGRRAFSAGADITEFGTAPSLLAAREARKERDVWAMLEQLPLITIAALHGICFGAGAELPLYCDLRIAARDTRIAVPELSLGYIPSAGGTQMLPRLGPPGVARRLVLSGDPIGTDRALSWGLVHEVVADRDLDARAFALATRWALADTPTLIRAKLAIRRGLDLSLRDAIAVDAVKAAAR